MGNFLSLLFRIMSQVVSLYTFMCFIRIIITWFPPINYSGFGRILGAVCDPFLNFFGRLPLRIGAFDFSPMLAIGFLSVLSTVLGSISITGRIHIGGTLAYLVLMIWSILSSIMIFFVVLMIIRLIALLISKKSGNNFWYLIDTYLSPIVNAIASRFYRSAIIPYKTALTVSIVMTLLFILSGRFAFSFIAGILSRLPI